MKRSSPLTIPKKPRQKDRWISRKEAADILGVSVATVRNYQIPYRQHRPRGKIFYSLLVVLTFKKVGFITGAL